MSQKSALRTPRLAHAALCAAVLFPEAFAAVSVPALGSGERPRLCAELRAGAAARAAVAEADPVGRAEALARRSRQLGLPLDADSVRVALEFEKDHFSTLWPALLGLDVTVLGHGALPAVPGRHGHGRLLLRVPWGALLDAAQLPGVRRVDQLERAFEPQDDLARELLGVEPVLEGECVYPRSGFGVRVGILDAGLDIYHPDLPAPAVALDVTDGEDPSQWSADVGSLVSAHGTLVAGAALGRGLLSTGRYAGSAPGADLCFYKTGEDITGISTEAALIVGIQQALLDGCRVVNLSHGSYDPFMDGSGALCQAIDAATAQGVLMVVAAGNEANARRHVSGLVLPDQPSQVFRLVFFNVLPARYEEVQRLQLGWRDGQMGDQNLELVLLNPNPGSDWNALPYDWSERGTESRGYELAVSVEPGELQVFEFQVRWAGEAPSEPVDPVPFHLTRWQGLGLFEESDSSGTLMTPGIADTALTVGAFAHRDTWVDASGLAHSYPAIDAGAVAVFSSRGPRIDGLQKPDLLGPGAGTITLLDSNVPPAPMYQVAGDWSYGELPGYTIALGTSFAAPHVAGAAALLFEAFPQWDAEDVRAALLASADRAAEPDTTHGHGVPDVQAALQYAADQGCDALLASANQVSLGGALDLRLDAGMAFAGELYWVLGSRTGTTPALELGPGVQLFLVADAYTSYTGSKPNQGPLIGTLGTLDGAGRGLARIDLGQVFQPSLVGTQLHHAFLVIDPVPNQNWAPFASNTVTVNVGAVAP